MIQYHPQVQKYTLGKHAQRTWDQSLQSLSALACLFDDLRKLGETPSVHLKMVSLIYFMVSEINILTKFCLTICYTVKINCTSFKKMHGFSINMQ